MGDSRDPPTAEEVAAALPDRPVPPDLLSGLVDELGWSMVQAPSETPDGREVVAMAFCFRPHEDGGTGATAGDDRGDALGFRFDANEGAWVGEVERRDVELNQWLRVSEIWAERVLGTSLEPEKLVTEIDGEVVEETFEDS